MFITSADLTKINKLFAATKFTFVSEVFLLNKDCGL